MSNAPESDFSSFLKKINKLTKLASAVDASDLLKFISSMDPEMIGKMMKMAKSQEPKQLPMIDGDFYSVSELLLK